MTGKERRERDAALERVLDDIDRRLYPQVSAAIDFARLDAIQQDLVLELERLISEGQLPPAPDAKTIAVRAAAMIATAIYQVPQDPRRRKPTDDDEDDCELCKAFSAGPLPS